MEPYVGLGHFTEDFADRFFGRDTECSLIIGNLRAARLTLLYAESGVGKSSLLRAGVVARLHGFAEHDVEVRGRPRLVPVVFSSWSEAPVAGLVRALAEAVRPYLDDGAELDLPEDDLERALELASAALEATLLVVLDQFEEYFLYPEAGPEEEQIAAQIARCVNRPDLRANFLISIREDSYARLGDLFRGKLTNVYANFLHLDFLGRDGARESIEKPIERVNELSANGHHYELEPALVEAVLDEVGRGRIEAPDEDGQRGGDKDRDEIETTYLQLVMRRLWEEETGAGSDRLRLATLEQLGGSQAVITSHLDRAMDDETDGASLSPDQRLVAASIFHFLVTSGGTKIALTAQDLADLSGRPRAEIEPVLQHLSSPALHILRPVVSENGQGEPRFEIFHDALARPIVEWRTRVEETERDARLKRERVEKERAQQAAAEAEAREERERKRKRLALVLGSAAVLVMLGLTTYFWLDSKNLAEERDAASQSLRAVQHMTELAEFPAAFGPATAALAGVEAYRLSPTDEARDKVLEELQLNPAKPVVLAGHTDGLRTIAYWPGADLLATGGYDSTVRLWNGEGEEISRPLVNPSQIERVVVSDRIGAKGWRLLVAGLDSGAVRLWRVDESGAVHPLHPLPPVGAGEVKGLAFDPQHPTRLAVGGSSGKISLWDLSDPSHPVMRGERQTEGEVTGLAFGHSGRILLAASYVGQAWRLSNSGFAALEPEIVDPRPVFSVAASANGSFAFGASGVVDLRDGVRERLIHLRQPGDVSAVTFARGGSVLASAGEDLNVTTWDVASGRPFGPPRMSSGFVNGLAVSPDGETIAAASSDGLAKLYSLQPGHPLAITVGGLGPREGFPEILGLAAGAGDLIAAAAGKAGTSVWKLPDLAASATAPTPLARIPGYSEAVAFHDHLLVTARGSSFVVWDTGSGCASMPRQPCRLAIPAKPHSQTKVSSLALAEQDGRLLLASAGEKSHEGLINLWDLTNVARTRTVDHLSTRIPKQTPNREPEAQINEVTFSPADPLIAIGMKDGKTRAWDISDPRDPRGIHIPNARGNEDQPVYAIAFSPDGSLLASGGGDQQVVLWKVNWHPGAETTVKATAGNLFQSGAIYSLAFSLSGEVLAAGDSIGRTCFYGVDSRSRIGDECLVGNFGGFFDESDVRAIAFTHLSGAPLLTAGLGQPIVAWSPLLWSLSDSEQIEDAVRGDACGLARRNLTAEEWDAVFGATKLANDRHMTCDQYPLPDE